MNLSPDFILMVVQTLPFFALLIGLRVILYEPMLAYLAARDEASVGARKAAVALAEKAAARLVEYEAALEVARNDVAEFRAMRRSEGQKAYSARLAQAKAIADDKLQLAMSVIHGETKIAQAGLADNAAALARDAATSVLGRPLTSMEA